MASNIYEVEIRKIAKNQWKQKFVLLKDYQNWQIFFQIDEEKKREDYSI